MLLPGRKCCCGCVSPYKMPSTLPASTLGNIAMAIYFSRANPNPEDIPIGVGICQDEGGELTRNTDALDGFGNPQCEYSSDYEVTNPWNDTLCTVSIFYVFDSCCRLVVNGWTAPLCGTNVHSIVIEGTACT